MASRTRYWPWRGKQQTSAGDEAPSPQAGGARAEERIQVASQWQLIWWRFRKHHLAMVGGVVVVLLYVMAVLSPFLAPYGPDQYDAGRSYQPPTAIRFVDPTGAFNLRPFVYGVDKKRDPSTFATVYTENENVVQPIYFLVKGAPYQFVGLIPWDVHLFGVKDPTERVYLLGADTQGRDLFSRLLYGSQLSLSIGLIGVAVSFVLGILLGGMSGYFGGVVDMVIQRVIEFLRSMPTIPLWLALSAALPIDWPIVRVYFAITIILSLIGWTGLGRVVRGRFLALREEDFVLAARLDACSELNIIVRQMVPSFASHIIAALTLAVPEMILSETALSFLGLGLRYPAVSWGVLLQEAQNIRSLAQAPWLLAPGGAVVIAVLSMNFLGDGLRDAADPYGR